ncbi:MAG: hypothetical protein K5886_11805 [Lachnospiraceae bacterium]|nr:hypothetical protein [Lachnospiraceae bacterium]
MKNNAAYYLIWDSLVGKQEDCRYYIFRNGQWEPDRESIIMDHLMGYDPSEPPGSPYGFGSGSVMDEMDEISYEEAMKLIGGNV